MLYRSKGRHQTKRHTKTDAGSSVISSDSKHRANDARDGLSLYSNRHDQSGLNGCCTAMWKTNGKTTTLSLFLDILFPKTEDRIYARQKNPVVNYSDNRISGGGGGFLEEMSCRRYKKKECKEQKEHHSYKIGTWNVRKPVCVNLHSHKWCRYRKYNNNLAMICVLKHSCINQSINQSIGMNRMR